MKLLALVATLFPLICFSYEGNKEVVKSLEQQFPAPLLFEKSNSTLVLIGNGVLDPDCKEITLQISQGHQEEKIRLGALTSYIHPGNDINFKYSYTCTINGFETGQSRIAQLPNWAPLNLLSVGAISIADFNNDSIYELVGTLGTSTGPKKISERLIGLEGLTLEGRHSRDVRFADFNNDGYLDAIANVYSENKDNSSDYNSYIQLYWGQPNGDFLIDEVFASKKFTGFGETIVVADLDNDEYVDILIPQYKIENSLNSYSRNLLFKNNGNNTFTEVGVSSGVTKPAHLYVEGAQALDFDQDGYIDLYVGGSLFRNSGNWTFTDIGLEIGLPGVFEEGAKFFDYDLDGDLDFILNLPAAKPRLFINTGGKFSELLPFPFPNEYFNSVFGMQTGDLNGDGLEDLILAGGLNAEGQGLPPRIYLNLNGSFIRQSFGSNEDERSDLVTFSDLNNDGALDIIARYNTKFRFGERRIFLNQNTPNYFIKIIVTSSGKKNQFGRVVKVTYPNGKVKVMTVDGGSGYMSNQAYPLLIANDPGSLLKFEVMCAKKSINFSAVNGNHTIDCE